MKLVRFELAKSWRKKQLLALLFLILSANILLHWYGNRGSQFQPGLSAYKRAAEKLAPMGEEEKSVYLKKKSEDLENIRVTEQIALWLNRKENTLESLSEEHQEIFKTWNPVYQEGNYLVFTDSLDHEITLVDELYQEAEQVTHYEEYLQQMQENQEELTEISIFAKEREESFSTRNIEKSRKDYGGRDASNVSWFPEKGITSSLDSPITGILFLVSVFLFAVWGMMEEKEKKLFFITRAAKQGIFCDISARIGALGISCLFLGVLLYGSNWLFYGITIGFWDLSLDIQSVAAYMQSAYGLHIGEFMVLSVLTKAAVAFCFGLLLQFVVIFGKRRQLPFLIGSAFLAANMLLYGLLPGVGVSSPFKYLNFMGIFHTENLYGDYLNFDFWGKPVSRTKLSVLLLLFLIILGCVLVIVAFCRGNNFTYLERQRRKIFSFHPHGSLFRYESYKLFVTNRGLFVILACLILVAGYYSSKSYHLSVTEEYYKGLMDSLDGGLTAQKEALLLSEKERFDDAEKKLEQISAMEQKGKISKFQANEQRDVWNAVLFFKPSFQRAWRQYERIQERGGIFIYDTGYLYLYGVLGEGFLIELLILVIGIILVFGNAMSMEYQNKTNLLICSSTLGLGRVFQKKACLCSVVGICLPVGTRLIYSFCIGETFPMRHWGSSIRGINNYGDLPLDVPIWLFTLLSVGVQVLVCSILALCILLLSCWRKNMMQAIITGAVLFAVPLVLYAQGVGFMKYLTVYPLYQWFGGLALFSLH